MVKKLYIYMLTKKDIKFIREQLKESKRPIFFYDDDPDGICSFLLLYNIYNKGRGILVNSVSYLDKQWVRKVDEYQPDKVFVLDIPVIKEDFSMAVKKPMFWIDHHKPIELSHVYYYNPRIKDPNAYIPTTMMAYQINGNPKNLWIATIGCLADWYFPNFIDQFIEKYPDLLSKKADLGKAVFIEPISELIKVFSFLLKGQQGEVRKNIKVLQKIESPYEILREETSQGTYLHKKFIQVNKEYSSLLKEGKKLYNKEDPLLVFKYSEKKWSFTSDLSNELSYLFQDKLIIVCRKKSGEYRCSIRAKRDILEIVQRSLEGLNGLGGGHSQACGVMIKENDWELFLQRLREYFE